MLGSARSSGRDSEVELTKIGVPWTEHWDFPMQEAADPSERREADLCWVG
jgi:hypothetical protein